MPFPVGNSIRHFWVVNFLLVYGAFCRRVIPEIFILKGQLFVWDAKVRPGSSEQKKKIHTRKNEVEALGTSYLPFNKLKFVVSFVKYSQVSPGL